MKKATLAALALSVCTLAPGMANAQEEFGTTGVSQYTTGNLGVNTTNPAREISVNADADDGKVLSVINSSNTAEVYSVSSLPHGGRFNMATAGNVEVIQLNTAGTSFITGSNVGIGTKTPTAQLEVSTNMKVGTTLSAAIVEIRGTGMDLAETFAVSSIDLKPGMIVSIDPNNAGKLMQSHEAYDRKVAGIISGAGDLHAGINLGDIPTNNQEQSIALTGRAWCWVDTSVTGAIQPGDTLTSSPTPGHAMKALNTVQGTSIGKAMTSLESGKGLVLVLINLH